METKAIQLMAEAMNDREYDFGHYEVNAEKALDALKTIADIRYKHSETEEDERWIYATPEERARLNREANKHLTQVVDALSTQNTLAACNISAAHPVMECYYCGKPIEDCRNECQTKASGGKDEA